MKSNYTKGAFFGFFLLLTSINIYAQDDELYKLLIQKNIISSSEADSVLAHSPTKLKKKEDKQLPIKLNAYIQGRYQYREEKTSINGFDLRRARLDLRGTIDKQWAYRLHAELANLPKLLDASASYKLNDALSVTAGQFKIPFSLENLTSSTKLVTIDRSQAVEALTARSRDVIGNSNGRDIGVQLGGSIIQHNGAYFLDYAAGIFNGAGTNVSDNNDQKDIAARLTIHPAKGLDIAGNIYRGTGRWALSAADAAENHSRNRYGFDASYVSGPVFLAAEYLKGLDASTDKEGWYALAAYQLIPEKVQLLAKYDTYDPNLGVLENSSDWYTVGANIFFSRWAKLQFSYTLKNETGTEIHNDLFSAQFQLQF